MGGDEYNWIEAHDEVMGQIAENEKIAAVYEGGISVYDSTGVDLGTVFEINNPIKMKFAVPEGLREAPLGYTRKFTIIRGHSAADDTRSAERLETTFDGEYARTETNLFSSFVVVYEDVKAEEGMVDNVAASPETGTMTAVRTSASVAAMTAAAAVGMLPSIVSFAYLVRRKD